MKVAIVGAMYLEPEETKTARFLLDSIFCRYATGAPTLITCGRPGIEALAEVISKKWHWISYAEDAGDVPFFLPKNRHLDNHLVQVCDILISIQRRNDKHSKISKRVRSLGKVAWEFYV